MKCVSVRCVELQYTEIKKIKPIGTETQTCTFHYFVMLLFYLFTFFILFCFLYEHRVLVVFILLFIISIY